MGRARRVGQGAATSRPAGDPGRRVLVVALGTRGDVEPAVRLGTALARCGDRVVVATFADGAAAVRAAGLRPLVVGPASPEAMWWHARWARDLALRHPGAMYLQIRTSLARHADAAAAALAPVVSRADLVVCGLAAAGLVPVLNRAGVPARLVLHAPLLPHPGGTSAWSSGLADLLPRPLEEPRQALMWGLARGLSSALAGGLARRVRADRGPLPGTSPLLSTSPVLDPLPAPTLVQTGWWADPTPVRPLQAGIAAWLARHPDAVLLGIGSLAGQDPEGRVALLVDTARLARVPAVVQVAGARPGSRADGQAGAVLVVGEVDHRALLPRVRAVVHHGGSGTTHAVTAAGRPQVVVPHLGDQPHYGRQVRRAGLGPAPVWHTRASAPALAHALRALLHDPTYSRAAQAAADRLRAEDGLGRTVQELAAQVPSGAVR